MKNKTTNRYVQLLVGSLFGMLFLFITVILILTFTDKSFKYGQELGADVSAVPTSIDVQVTLPEDMSVKDTADLLEEKGVISNALFYNIWGKRNDVSGDYAAGTYLLNTSMENEDIDATLKGEMDIIPQTEPTATP